MGEQEQGQQWAVAEAVGRCDQFVMSSWTRSCGKEESKMDKGSKSSGCCEHDPAGIQLCCIFKFTPA